MWTSCHFVPSISILDSSLFFLSPTIPSFSFSCSPSPLQYPFKHWNTMFHFQTHLFVILSFCSFPWLLYIKSYGDLCCQWEYFKVFVLTESTCVEFFRPLWEKIRIWHWQIWIHVAYGLFFFSMPASLHMCVSIWEGDNSMQKLIT